jgi:hypothetical protein
MDKVGVARLSEGGAIAPVTSAVTMMSTARGVTSTRDGRRVVNFQRGEGCFPPVADEPYLVHLPMSSGGIWF